MRLHGAADNCKARVGTLSRPIGVLLSILGCVGCGGDGHKAGGGPLVYAASEVAVIEGRPSGADLVALVPGLTSVEIIESETGNVNTVPLPQGKRAGRGHHRSYLRQLDRLSLFGRNSGGPPMDGLRSGHYSRSLSECLGYRRRRQRRCRRWKRAGAVGPDKGRRWRPGSNARFGASS
jgi:hypothetical protein